MTDASGPVPDETPTDTEEERWLSISGRRWRRTDPCLPADVIKQLQTQLGRGRSGVRTAKAAGDDQKLTLARRRVGMAKHGLGERGPYWWDEPEADRVLRARQALADLTALDS